MERRESLVKKRTDRKMSQKQVVEHLCENFGITITESYYGMIEQGKRTPKLELALAISKLFDCSPEDIFLNKNTTKRWVVA
ncbi:helix-turn-helix transcriptional regulator [Alicyclobacillus acidoterrestris]|uniref:helix-turn-helix transcriptional regulator n=1 Tax=Alicyclobacillus acidoterrestris TaxID=1450 RepID=UPI003F52DB51